MVQLLLVHLLNCAQKFVAGPLFPDGKGIWFHMETHTLASTSAIQLNVQDLVATACNDCLQSCIKMTNELPLVAKRKLLLSDFLFPEVLDPEKTQAVIAMTPQKVRVDICIPSQRSPPAKSNHNFLVA